MFEKEAESYATRECCMTCNNINHFCKEKCECWTFAKKGAEFGYNKANKWHYVKNGDLPKHEVNVLVLYNVQCIDIAHYNCDYKEWHFRDSIVRDVIAWCELPKLPKFEE